MPVLVVDDNATNRRILSETLQAWGILVREAANAATALAALQQAAAAGEPFRLMLTDACMPEEDGFALAQQVQRHPELARAILIMMLSSAEQAGQSARCREAGIAGYLIKPVRRAELRKALLHAMGQRKRPDAAIEAPPSEPRPNPASISRSRRILLVEDNAVNRLVAQLLLEKRGHRVVVAGNGREALDLLAQQSIDLVLMDVQMPEMGGIEATEALREKEKRTGQRLPVVAMTAGAMKGDEERCRQAGMDGYVVKPIKSSLLFAAIEEACSAPAGEMA